METNVIKLNNIHFNLSTLYQIREPIAKTTFQIKDEKKKILEIFK